MEERRTFYQIQEQQTQRTIWLFIGLILFYFIGVGILYALIAGVIFSALLGIPIFSPWHFVIIFVISALLAIFQWENAKTSGAEFILEKLRAAPLDTSDLYHKKLGDIVEEVRIGAGCKKPIRICVIPANSVNTCAIIGADGVPIIAATEGALARFTREELQSAIAHELAHIMSGDALYITFACALGNIFQRLSDMLEIEEERPVFFNTWMQRPEGRQMELLGQTISGALALLSRLFTFTISRQREYLADANAVQITRNPEALARVIYKAHKSFSYLGDAGEIYSPLFIVPPESAGEIAEQGFLSKIFSTHPPVMERINRLMGMANKTILKALSDIMEQNQQRENARIQISSVDEKPSREFSDDAPASDYANPDVGSLWEIRNSQGKWEGPFTIATLFTIPWFTGMATVRPAGSDEPALARSFPPILETFRASQKKNPAKGQCPVCGQNLADSHYEGVPIKQCQRCGGRLVPEAGIVRIIARREVKPSDYLLRKARRWKRENQINVQAVNRIKNAEKHHSKKTLHNCPLCGFGMIRRLFSYQYFVEVDDCKSCKQVWFDGDELEILQILIEDAGY